MEDSPLSIVANVAGILTFIAAIIAFISVRYRIIISGLEEILSVFEAAKLSVEETKLIRHALPEPNNRPELKQIAKYLDEILAIEVNIIRNCTSTLGAGIQMSDEAMMMVIEEPSGNLGYHIRRASLGWLNWRSYWRILSEYCRVLYVFVQHSPMMTAVVWGLIRGVVTHGFFFIPIAMRWYSVRKEVMKNIQQRNILRSRIMHQQMLLFQV